MNASSRGQSNAPDCMDAASLRTVDAKCKSQIGRVDDQLLSSISMHTQKYRTSSNNDNKMEEALTFNGI